MGLFMESNSDFVQHSPNAERKGMVDNEEASMQRVSRIRGRLNWDAILARVGLEAPGYHETVDQMKKEGRIKNKDQSPYNELSAEDQQQP